MKTKDRKKYIYTILLVSILFFVILFLDNPTILTKKKNSNVNMDGKIETTMTSTQNSIQEEKSQEILQNAQDQNTEQNTDQNLAQNGQQDNINSFSNTEDSMVTSYKGYPVIAKLEIPQIELETYVISEYSEQALGVSVTKFYGGDPNTVGNFCIAGHNYITKNMFHNLKKLSVGNQLFLTDLENNKETYTVYSITTVGPNDTQCLSQKTNGRVELTLITCTTDSSKRIIVKAVKV